MKGAKDMFKKIFSMMLVFLLCCSASITVFAQAEHSHVEENDASIGNEETAIINVTSPTSEIDSDYVFTATADPEYWDWLVGAPDEILSASTIELLEYFLNSRFVEQSIYSYASSTMYKRELGFSSSEAFRELISRDDFMETLEIYAESILNGSNSSEQDKFKFEKLLAQPSVKSLISDSEYSATNYPNLRSIYITSQVVPSSVSDLVGKVDIYDIIWLFIITTHMLGTDILPH